MPNPKDKGAGFELEVARYLSAHLGTGVFRSRLTQALEDNKQGNYDLVGLPGLAPELKRVEKLNFREAYRQARKNAANKIPVVISRQNRQATGESLVTLSLDDFLILYRAYLNGEPA